MKAQSLDHLDRIAAYLRETREREVSLAAVVGLAEVTVESLRSFFHSVDMTVYRELSQIAAFITSMKQEIGRLQPHDLKQHRIPQAGQELDAIIKATETATNSIMSAAEEVMNAEIDDLAAYKVKVDEKMMLIFEACSFQDITGQRVSKVVETLKHIDSRVSRFADAIHAADDTSFMTDEEKKRAERREKLILNGPALAGGVKQDDVDNLFAASPKAGSLQDDIDALFK